MNSPPLFGAFCCHAAACFHTHWTWNIFWATGDSLSLSLFPLSDYRQLFFPPPPSLCSLLSLSPSKKKPVTPPPHHTLTPRLHPCAGLGIEMMEGMGGFDWLKCWDVILCKLKCEVCVCVWERKGLGQCVMLGFIASQAHLFVFYTSFRLRRAGSTFRLRVTQFHNTERLSLSLII